MHQESHIVRENNVRRVVENLIELKSFTENTVGDLRRLVEIVLTNFQDQHGKVKFFIDG